MNVSNFDRVSFLSARGDSIINFDIKNCNKGKIDPLAQVAQLPR